MEEIVNIPSKSYTWNFIFYVSGIIKSKKKPTIIKFLSLKIT